MKRTRVDWAYVAALAWLALTVSMTLWWLVFGLEQARKLSALGGEAEQLLAAQRMFTWEGGVLIALLLAGGFALVVGIRRERARSREVQDFFLSFTHDLRTALASLRLQAESLQADHSVAADNPNVERLLRDAVRLELQLENSLFFAQAESGLLPERIDLRDLILGIAEDWPRLTVEVSADANLHADRRALASVLRNIFQNAATHGRATRVIVAVSHEAGRVRLTITDDGTGPPADAVIDARRPFSRPAATSGTGMGLFVSRRLVERMNGALECGAPAGRGGFEVAVTIPESA